MNTTDIIRGTDLTFILNIAAPGFDPSSDRWKIAFRIGGEEVGKVESTDATQMKSGFVVAVDTALWPSGPLYYVVTAYIPDVYQQDGKRTEIASGFTGFNIV
jgi:hypothetical protein